MPNEKSVQDARSFDDMVGIHAALVEIIAVMNRPQRDDEILARAGVRLDRALFPLLVGVQHFGPIGVMELADRAGRDHTTVSRQLAKLEKLGLIERRGSVSDHRVREAVLSAQGRSYTDKIDSARQKIGRTIFASWEDEDLTTFARLMRKFADDIKDLPTEE
ncbi:DNA-binding MarR family transcriptional regulator [Roseibium marinum]|uniref:DNA-binding MarR family transcriptional regulator n=2 Tax=Roseibium marinum TaxID=281252 RepID=A0A2S3V3J2_9HYPH|nr:DNA-binding MarR family transcriptional regulator [Roseibium marinum]